MLATLAVVIDQHSTSTFGVEAVEDWPGAVEGQRALC